MSTDSVFGALRPVHEHCGIPPNPGPKATLDLFITGELGLVFGCDGVEVVGCEDHWHTEVQDMCATEQAEHDFPPALVALSCDEIIERLLPLTRFIGVGIRDSEGIRVLGIDRHAQPLCFMSVACGHRLSRWECRVRPGPCP